MAATLVWTGRGLMTLDELSVKYDTDKGSTGHWYTPYYERIFSPIRNDVESLVEVGIGSGASLRMWRDYFLGAMIYGIDMNPCNLSEPRIACYDCEQTDSSRLTEYIQNKKPEIIVEDASHDMAKTMMTLDCLWPILQSRGWYVIEDMDRSAFPPEIGRWYGKRPEQIREFYLFNDRSDGSAITFIQKQ